MSQFNSPAYDVQKTTGRCAITGSVLQPEEEYIATLVEDDDDLLRRVDISTAAWEEGKRPENLFSYWKAVVPKPDEKKKLFVDDDVLMNLLRRLEDATQPQRIAFRFVLTLILMRKKLLRYDYTDHHDVTDKSGDGEKEEGEMAGGEERVAEEWWVLTPKLDLSKGPMGKWNNDEKISVLDPRLDEESIRQVTDQLGEILQAEL